MEKVYTRAAVGAAARPDGDHAVSGVKKSGEKAHRMTCRCQGWDYCQPCIYQITIVLADRRSKALGRLLVADGRGNWVEPAVAKGLGLKPEEVEAKVELSELGAAILAHWKRIGEFTPEIRPRYCQIMPDHLHAILQVTRPMKRPLGNAVGGFKTGCEKIYRQLALAICMRMRRTGTASTIPPRRARARTPGWTASGNS